MKPKDLLIRILVAAGVGAVGGAIGGGLAGEQYILWGALVGAGIGLVTVIIVAIFRRRML